jgi:hypothetical protein
VVQDNIISKVDVPAGKMLALDQVFLTGNTFKEFPEFLSGLKRTFDSAQIPNWGF